MPPTPPTGPDGHDPFSGFVDAALKMGFHHPEPPSVLDQLDGLTSAPARVLLHELPDDGAPVVHADGAEGDAFAGGRYQVLGEIGRGGVGRVLQGRDRDLGRDIAIKVLRDEQAANPEMVRRFVEEAQIGGQLQHPGVMPVHELGLRADRRPYFTMKLVRGQTLASVLGGRRPPGDDLRRVLGLYAQVCQAIAYAHARGVVHRDLKPTNVLVGGFGEVHVTDWGLAKVLARGAEEDARSARPVETVRTSKPGTASLAGSVLGTPAYMPPEQALGEVAQVDRRADVFGLGAILCEILTGAPPYTGDEAEVRERAKSGDLDDAQRRLASCGADRELVELARACLAADREERLADAGAVVQRLDSYFAARDERVRRAEIEAAEARVEAVGARRARRLALGLAVSAATVAVLIAAGAIGWSVLERRQQRQRETQLAKLQDAIQKTYSLQAAAAAVEPANVDSWMRARDAAQNAVAQLRDDVPAEMAARVEALKLEIEHEFGLAQTDVARRAGNEKLLAALEACRFERLDVVFLAEKERNGSEVTDLPGRAARERHEATARAFADLGIDVVRDDEASVLAALQARGADEALALGLDAWAQIAPRDVRERLGRLARALDPDPWRPRLRDAMVSGNGAAIEALLRDPELLRQPPDTVALAVAAYEHVEPVETWRAPVGAEKAVCVLRGPDHELVEKTLRAALLEHPAHVGLNWWLAEELMKDPDRVPEALRYAHAIVVARDEDLSACDQLGEKLLVAGRNEEALGWFERVYGEGALPRVVLAARLGMLRRHEAAVEVAQQAVDLFPEDGHACWELAHMLEGVGRLDDAVEHAERAIQLAPDRPQPYFYLGVARQAQGRLDQAMELFETAERKDATVFGPPYQQGRQHYALGHLGAALAAFRRAAACPDLQSPEARAQLSLVRNCIAVMLDLGGDFEGAIAEYRACLAIDSEDVRSWENLAVMLERRGACAEAEKTLRRGIARAHGSYQRKNLARLLLAMDEPAAAVAAIQPYVAQETTSEVLALYADTLAAHDELEPAVAAYRRALELAAAGAERAERAAALARGERLLRLSEFWEEIASGALVPDEWADLEAAAALCTSRGRPCVAAALWHVASDRFAERFYDLDEDHVEAAITAALHAAETAAEPGDAAAWRETARGWVEARHVQLEAALQPVERGLFGERVEDLLLSQRGFPAWAVVRGEGLETLPAAEQAAWRAVWHRVDAMLQRIWDVRRER